MERPCTPSMSPSAPGRRRERTTEVLANESRGPPQWCGPKGSRWVIELLDKGAIGAEGAACHVTGLAVGGESR